MLKAKSENPKATLLMLFLNAVREEESKTGDSTNPKVVSYRTRRITKYLDIEQSIIDAALGKGGMGSMLGKISPDFILLTGCMDLLGNFDEYFKSFLKKADPYTGASRAAKLTHYATIGGVFNRNG